MSFRAIALFAVFVIEPAFAQEAFLTSTPRQVVDWAAVTPPTVLNEVRTNVVKVQAWDGSQWSTGSGIYLGDGLILTAEHVVRDADQGRTVVFFPNPSDPQAEFVDTVEGKSLTWDKTWDQALIELSRLPSHNPPGSPLADDDPKSGDTVTFAGYPGGKTLHLVRGDFNSYWTAQGQTDRSWFDASAPVVGGFSGGAAYNERGQLYGNLWGSTGYSTTAVCLGRTKRFLFPWNARLEAWRLSLTAGALRQSMAQNRTPRIGGPQDCPNGQCPTPYRPIPGGGDGGSLTPLPPTPAPPPSYPPSPPIVDPSPPPKFELSESDLDRIVNKIKEAIKNDESFKGPPGEPGKDGAPGEAGQPGERGEPGASITTNGCECKDEPPNEPGKHFVVIGDPKAEYYGRLKTDVEKTATYFDAIELHPPPKGKNVGTLPAIVMFVGNTSVFTHRGVIPVQTQLNKIRQGEFQ